MANYTATYRDETHTYRLSGAEIVMLGADGLEHRVVRDTPEQARKHLKALIQMGSLRKVKPLSALQRVEGQTKNTKGIIPRNRRKAQ
jgi:hypothetical protein